MSAEPLPVIRAESVEDAFVSLATRIESIVDAKGWDRPAALWEVVAVDAPDPSIARSAPVAEDALEIVFGLRVLEVLDGDPVDALVGHTVSGEDVVGVVLVTEAWAHSEERLAADPDPERPPSAYADRVELRSVCVVMRDGTEALVHRVRGAEPEVTVAGRDGVTLDGRVLWRLRRTIGRRSGAGDMCPLPTPAEVRVRVTLGGLTRMWSHSPEPVRPRLLTLAVDQMTAPATPDWDTERLTLIAEAEQAAALFRTDGATWEAEEVEHRLRLLRWADGPMAAAFLDETLPTLADLALRLWVLVLGGDMEPADARTAAAAAGISAPAGTWRTEPRRDQPCPCGSGHHYGVCHRRGSRR